jgi:hypothetical protein
MVIPFKFYYSRNNPFLYSDLLGLEACTANIINLLLQSYDIAYNNWRTTISPPWGPLSYTGAWLSGDPDNAFICTDYADYAARYLNDKVKTKCCNARSSETGTDYMPYLIMADFALNSTWGFYSQYSHSRVWIKCKDCNGKEYHQSYDPWAQLGPFFEKGLPHRLPYNKPIGGW